MNKKEFNGFLLDWPAVCVVIGGVRHSPDTDDFEDDDLKIKVSLENCGGIWRKHLDVTAKRPLPTPDYVEMDRQTVPDPELKLRGYIATGIMPKREGAEEEGGGLMPRCGYPLIGRNIFAGLEHQAGFALLETQNSESSTYSLRHHPVWNGDRLEAMDAVFCVADHPEKMFAEYIDSIRAPLPLKPFFAFCSFWSDPYLGNFEYDVTGDSMRAFIGAYQKLDLHPDVFTFDAGWQKRNSFFEPKPGLEPEHYSSLSLWISHNGPTGIAPEFLRRNGIAVGSGESAAYSGNDYGVLLDKKLEDALTKRFCELAKQVRHFKIDWDNDCAVSAEFMEKYPTRNHVREGSINTMNRIMNAIRKVNPELLARNGWWPSPWWLKYAQHVFLSDSGDSEFGSLPCVHQRSSAATHRDMMYFNCLLRDGSMIPLSSFDNHEFPKAPRNPFRDTPGSWCDNAMLALMRGSTYLTWTLQPASLDTYQTNLLRRVMAFARDYGRHLFVKYGRMFGGNPGKGELYGFLHPGLDSSWCVLRNPHPLPQTVRLADFGLPESNNASILQFYPDFRMIDRNEEFVMLPEEVKTFVFSPRKITLPHPEPFQIQDDGQVCFPDSQAPGSGLEFGKCEWKDSGTVFISLTAPYRMKELRLLIGLTVGDAENIHPRIMLSRYYGAHEGAKYALPLTEIVAGDPGYGELKNPETLHSFDRRRFFSVPLPDGGTCNLHIEFSHPPEKEKLEIWSVGYEARSSSTTALKSPVAFFTKSLPPPHPYGFGTAKSCCLKSVCSDASQRNS